ncbi:MAG: PQQ-like beta-propeller repeat protein [Gemmatimonadetes bacterium]|nr:PQQ-like beta-propeller repeat protein [Gemmatimonadota bacterium]
MLVAAWTMVNAIACTPARRIGPQRDPRPWAAHLLVPGLAPSAAETLASDPVRLWTATAGRGFAGPPAIGDSVVIVQATDARLLAFARSSGKRLWGLRVGGLGSTGPLLDGERVYTGTAAGQVAAVSLRTGRFLWKRDIQSVAGPLALSVSRLFAVGTPGRLYAFNRVNGALQWRRDLEGVLRSGPTLLGANVVVASDDSVFQVNAQDGRVVKAVPVRGLSLNPPAVAGSSIIYASPDGFVIALNADDLTQQWRVELGSPVLGSPAVARDTVFAATITGSIWQIPLFAPGLATHVDLGVSIRASPTPIADGLLVATVAGELIRLPGAASQSRWQVRVDGPIDQPPIVDRGLLIFTDGRGRIHAWK